MRLQGASFASNLVFCLLCCLFQYSFYLNTVLLLAAMLLPQRNLAVKTTDINFAQTAMFFMIRTLLFVTAADHSAKKIIHQHFLLV
jgi:hypothetical protein